MARPILRDVATNLPRRVAPVRAALNRRAIRAGYEPTKNSVEYSRFVFDDLTTAAGLESASGRVLEIGPGGHVGVSLLFLAAGAEHATCIDILPWRTDQSQMYRELAPNADELVTRIDYRCPDSIETTPLPDGSFDIIFSAACLEHVSDPMRAAQRIVDLLAPGGLSVHGIDLRDHRDLDAPHGFLRYPDWLWHAATSHKISTNRWRASDWKDGFKRAGLVDVAIESRGDVPVSAQERAAMDPQFRAKSLEDLSMTMMIASGRKPAQPGT